MKNTLSISSTTPDHELEQVDGVEEVHLALMALDELLSVLEDLATGLREETQDFRAVLRKLDAALPASAVAT